MQTLFGLDVVVDDDLHARAAAEGTGSKTRTTSSAGSRSRRAKPLLAAVAAANAGACAASTTAPVCRGPRNSAASSGRREAGDTSTPGRRPGCRSLRQPPHRAGPPRSAHPFHHADSSPQSPIDSDFRISPASSCAVALTALAVSIRTRRRRCAAPNHNPPGQKSSGRSCSATTQSRCSTRMVSRSPSMLPTMS